MRRYFPADLEVDVRCILPVAGGSGRRQNADSMPEVREADKETPIMAKENLKDFVARRAYADRGNDQMRPKSVYGYRLRRHWLCPYRDGLGKKKNAVVGKF